MNEELLKVEKVAVLIDTSIQTINNWYRFKRENPDNEYAVMLPEYIQEGPRQTRYWKRSDVKYLKKFKKAIPHGQHGILGSVTHRKKEVEDGTKES